MIDLTSLIIITNMILIIIANMILMMLKVGHNLGMHHDSTAGCAKDGFIMSPSRGTKGSSSIVVDVQGN